MADKLLEQNQCMAVNEQRRRGCLPPASLQFVRDDPLRLRFLRFRPLLAVVLRAHPLAHPRQQLLANRLLAQTPASPDRFEFLALLRPAPFLQRLLRLLPPRRTVLGDAPLAQQPVHPQPSGPLRRRHQIHRPTAPNKPFNGCAAPTTPSPFTFDPFIGICFLDAARFRVAHGPIFGRMDSQHLSAKWRCEREFDNSQGNFTKAPNRFSSCDELQIHPGDTNPFRYVQFREPWRILIGSTVNEA